MRLVPVLGGLLLALLGLAAAATLTERRNAEPNREAPVARAAGSLSALCRPMFPEPIAQRTACLGEGPAARGTAGPGPRPEGR